MRWDRKNGGMGDMGWGRRDRGGGFRSVISERH